MRASKATNNKINMCNTCVHCFSNCKQDLIEFGDGIGNDNVIVCSSYMPQALHKHSEDVTPAYELGIFKRYDNNVYDIIGEQKRSIR